MAQYRDLNAPPQRTFAEIVAAMQEQAKSSKTGASCVKDLGEAGDVVWPRPDGTAVSMRDVDLDLADARQRIEDAEGDLAGAQARIDTALDAEGHIREDEILRNATLLGDTVVQEINVTGKLIGTDGVFTGTVDFANVNVTGELLANEISGEHIYGTVIEGGEIRTGSDGSRGSFRLGDRAYVSPVDGYASPGLQLEAPDQEYVYPAGLGVDSRSVSVSGGRTADGRYGRLQVNPGGVSAVVSPAPGDTLRWGSRISSDSTSVRLAAGQPAAQDGAEILVAGPVILDGQEVSAATVRLQIDHNGKSSRIQAINGTTTVESSDGTTKRSLKLDSDGVWVTTGSKAVNLEGTTWTSLSPINGWSAYSGGGGYYNGLRAQRTPLGIRLDGTVKGGAPGSVVAMLPGDMQDVAAKQFPVVTSAGPAVMGIYGSANGFVIGYLSGPSSPGFVSVSVDAALR